MNTSTSIGRVVEITKALAARGPILSLRRRLELMMWDPSNTGVPAPHLVKQRLIRTYAAKHGLRVLVETGTYLGEMVAAMTPYFDRIVSIELSESLAAAAKQRFRSDPRVDIIQGDSGTALGSVLAGLKAPALFWLDGHYSGGVTARGALDTPIVAEVEAILRHPVAGHVILIDDARCFGADKDYPTFDELKSRVHAIRPEVSYELSHDVIRIGA